MTDTTPTETRIRLNLISELAFSGTPDQPRPIHMLRTGTFTDMSGRDFTFTAEHLATLVSNFQAGKRRRPPITERHDFGRAIGRVVKLWTDESGDNLYGMPTWNAAGRALLSDEVYDGFSVEIDIANPTLIGGSLTNYPAVDGLEPVTLEAPPFEAEPAPVSAPAGGATSEAIDQPITTTEVQTMAEPDVQTQLPDAPPAEPVALPPLTPPVIASNDPAVQAQVNAVVAQMTAQLEEQRRMVLEQAQAQFQRELANMQAQQAIQTYAQHITTPTLSRPSGLPGQASDYSAFLASLTADQRKAAQVLFDRILASGLVSFEEIGSAGDGEGARSAKEEHEALVVAEMAKNGNSRVAALQSVNRARPDLYAALNGGR